MYVCACVRVCVWGGVCVCGGGGGLVRERLFLNIVCIMYVCVSIINGISNHSVAGSHEVSRSVAVDALPGGAARPGYV